MSRKINRVTLGGITFVSFKDLPLDLKMDYASYDEFIIDKNQWWVATECNEPGITVTWAPTSYVPVTQKNSVIMRKASKSEIQHYRSPELVRIKL